MSDLFEMCAEYTKQQCESAQDDRYDSDAEDFKRESKQLMLDNPIILQNQINPPDWQELQAEDEKDWSNNFKCRSCGEKFADEFASDDDVALCKWCNGEEDREQT